MNEENNLFKIIITTLHRRKNLLYNSISINTK